MIHVKASEMSYNFACGNCQIWDLVLMYVQLVLWFVFRFVLYRLYHQFLVDSRELITFIIQSCTTSTRTIVGPHHLRRNLTLSKNYRLVNSPLMLDAMLHFQLPS